MLDNLDWASLLEIYKTQGGRKMKLKLMFVLFIPIFIGAVLLGGCATTGKVTEPSRPDSTLLIGRIKLACSNFPQYWYCNGEHTSGIVIDLRNVSTKEIVSIKSKGSDGLFSLIDPKEGIYAIIRLTFKTGSGRSTTTLYFGDRKSRGFKIVRNSVNNMGDISWQEIYLTKIDESTGATQDSLDFKRNYEEVKTWFGATYPESEWNRKDWLNVDVIVK